VSIFTIFHPGFSESCTHHFRDHSAGLSPPDDRRWFKVTSSTVRQNNTISGGRIAPMAGGVLILHAGQVIGSVGMSGDLSDNDEACTIAGMQKAGFDAEVGEAALGKQ